MFRVLANEWNRALFEPQSPVPLALYRILFGLLVTAKLILLRSDWTNWFGVHGWVTLATMHKMEGGLRLNLFDVLPQNDFWITCFFWTALAFAISLTLGVATRLSCVAVFLALVSIDERELYAMNSGDTFLRVASFFLIFAPVDAALSVDRLRRIWRGKEGAEIKPQMVWAQRMIQFQVALLYFVTAWWKSGGNTWWDGTAVYYVHHLDEFRRFWLPSWLDAPILVKFQTWFGLAVEFALGTLVWIKDCRYWVLLAGIVLHLSLEYSMNVPLFQFVMMSTFILFVDPEDLSRVWARARETVREWVGPPVKLIYPRSDIQSQRLVNFIRALDTLHRVHFVEDQTAKAAESVEVLVSTPAGPVNGFSAVRELGRVVPLLWFLRLIPWRMKFRRSQEKLSAGPSL